MFFEWPGARAFAMAAELSPSVWAAIALLALLTGLRIQGRGAARGGSIAYLARLAGSLAGPLCVFAVAGTAAKSVGPAGNVDPEGTIRIGLCALTLVSTLAWLSLPAVLLGLRAEEFDSAEAPTGRTLAFGATLAAAILTGMWWSARDPMGVAAELQPFMRADLAALTWIGIGTPFLAVATNLSGLLRGRPRQRVCSLVTVAAVFASVGGLGGAWLVALEPHIEPDRRLAMALVDVARLAQLLCICNVVNLALHWLVTGRRTSQLTAVPLR